MRWVIVAGLCAFIAAMAVSLSERCSEAERWNYVRVEDPKIACAEFCKSQGLVYRATRDGGRLSQSYDGCECQPGGTK